MNVTIWGTGKGSAQAKRICREYGWNIIAYIDNDTEKQGSKKDGIDIISPEIFRIRYGTKECIIVGTAIEEVQKQAEMYSSHVITWQVLQKFCRGSQKDPQYESMLLQERNLCNCVLLPDRKKMLLALAEKTKSMIMAEIGVAFGEFSQQIFQICRPIKLYLIDAWEGERFAHGYEEVMSSFKNQIKDGQVEICRGYSTDQLDKLQSEELDWAYIDTVHDYETTYQELILCSQKVKREGYICGHDYTKYNTHSRLDYGVYDAVNRFAVEFEYEFLYLTMESDGLHSFCLRKIL